MKKHIFIFAIFLIIISCKEKGETPSPEPPPTEMLARTWKVNAVTINGQADNTTDYSNYRFTFNANETYNFTMPGNQQGTWELIANATALTLDKGTANEQRVEVPKLSETTLELEFTEQSDKTGTRRILYTLVP